MRHVPGRGLQNVQGFNQAIKIWWTARKIGFARRIFNYLYRQPLSGMKDIIENAVNQRTVANVMNWLDYKRIIHCQFCPDTEQLQNHPMGKLCRRHIEMAGREAVKA